MKLQGQGDERGYAMAALLVSLAVMSVLMSVALPTWRHQAQREKEAELVFRGEQYARAVALFRAKNANAFPSSIDVLVQGKYLRKKYLDPITNKDFDVIGVGAQTPTNQGQGQSATGRGTNTQTQTGRGLTPAAANPSPFAPTGQQTGPVAGGIMGVHSKSKDDSIRIYNGQTRYDQWNFVFTALNRPGGNTPGAANPGGPGGAQNPGPGGRGQNNNGRGTGQGNGPGRGGPGTFGFPPPPPPAPATAPPMGGRSGRGGI